MSDPAMETLDRPDGNRGRPSQPVVRPSQPVTAPGAEPKLVIEKFADGGVACIKFTGTIDESFEGKKLAASAAADTLVLDLGGVKKISSFGIREWVDFVTGAARHSRQVVLIECAPKVMDQLNMVANFAGGGRVFSFYAPFRCDYCDSEHMVLLQIDRDHEAIKSMKLAERPCLSCKESMYFDEDGATFFSYVVGQDPFQLEPAVEAFLASKLDYAVSDRHRKLRVDKLIEARTTYLRLSGDLDGSFPRDKLAEGLEGTVVVDLGAVGKIEPAGAVQWRGFVALVAPVAEQLYLAAAPPAFIEKLCTRDDLDPKVQVLTAVMPYTCPSCGTTSAHEVELAAHRGALGAGAAPELGCAQCKHAMRCHAGDAVLALLPGLLAELARPGDSDLVKSIAILRERAIAAATPARPAARATATPATGTPGPARAQLAVGALTAALLAVVAAAGYLVYERATARELPPGRGEITARSAERRPAWITGDAPAAAACSELADGQLSCVGVSSVSARQDDADDEAADAAFDALAHALAARITDARWRSAVLPIYAAARDAKLAAFDRDPSSTTARREVREARRAVAQALRATGAGVVPAAPAGRYWEELVNSDGKRYLAFAQVVLGPAELARLIDGYTQHARALGATVIGMFPAIAWRYPRLERGAVVVGLASGPLLELGLAEQYVVLALAGRDVSDAASFARLASDEYAGLIARGGTLRLKVQAADGAPREFATAIAAPKLEPAAPSETTRTRHAPRGSATGINVWDRYSGGASRDDPTQ